MYGLRVAWCVFGDSRVEMAKDLFGRSGVSSGIAGNMGVAEVQHPESAFVEMPMHEVAFEWEQPRPSAHQSSYSHMEVAQRDADSDSDSATSSDSDYDELSDEDTESGESDELDDEDEIHRQVLASFNETSLDSSPALDKHAHVVHDDSRWEVLAFEVRPGP